MVALKDRWLDLLDEHPRLDHGLRQARRWIPPVNFITIHYTYFVAGIIVSSVIFWASSEPLYSVSYVDSLFLVTSAMTNTGLNTINLSTLTAWQQILLWLLFIVGSNIWVSFWTVMFRKRAFEQRFEDIVQKERDMRKSIAAERRTATTSLRRAFTSKPNPVQNPELGITRLESRRSAAGNGSTSMKELKAPGAANGALDLAVAVPSTPSSSRDKDNNRTELGIPASATIPDHVSFVEPVSGHQGEPNNTSAYDPGHHLSSHGNGRRSSNASSAATDESEDFLYHWKNFLTKHNVSRNGQFYDLSSDERERLGGTEYRAVKILAWTVPLYAVIWQLLGAVALGAWIADYRPNRDDLNGANAWWAGIFAGVSAFNNAGMSLLDDSMIPFSQSYFVLIVVGTLVVAGNTGYPILLRAVLWTYLKLLNFFTAPTAHGPTKETLEFTLKYPRRVYTTLFPARATWWLLAILILINTIDWVAYELLNIGNPAVENLTDAERVIGGLFQAVSVRAAGFVIISISSLYIGLQTLYFITMYISVYPVVITMRNSNVYEERSLGIYEDDPSAMARYEEEMASATSNANEPSRRQFLRRRRTGAVLGKAIKTPFLFNGVGATRQPKPGEETSPVSFIGQQIRGQLAHDLWWLVLAALIVVMIETDHFNTDPVTFSVFNIFFESTSAYGCVGLSVGLPDQSYSFSGALHTASKVVLCFVMVRGRHRGLPVAVDRAVRLPGDQLRQEEEQDTNIRRTKTMMFQQVRSREV